MSKFSNWKALADYKTRTFQRMLLNPLPDDKILNWSKFKQIADHILNCI